MWQTFKASTLLQGIHSESKNETQNVNLLKDICKLCFALIRVVALDNKVMQLEAARYLNALTPFIGKGVGATETISSILRDNEKLLYLLNAISLEDIDKIGSNFVVTREAKELVMGDKPKNLIELYLKELGV